MTHIRIHLPRRRRTTDARITKGMIQAAQSELRTMWELAIESGNGNPNPRSIKNFANSATNYMKVLSDAKEPLPDFIARNKGFLTANDWRFPYGS